MAPILVIDLGTTYFKFALFDRTGQLGDVVRLAPPTASPRVGYLELEAGAFASCIAEGIGHLRRNAADGLSSLHAVTFATQPNSFLLLDGHDRPVTPIILWPDRRAEQMEDEIRHRAAIPALTATTGVPGVNYQFMIAKLLWLQRRAPEAWQRMRRLCLISDYLSLLITGRHATEAGAAALTALVDVPRGRWWPAMLDPLELDARCLPDIVRAGTDLGAVLPAAAERFGLPRGCRFVIGCLDQYAGAIGVGNVGPGAVSETTGTVLAPVRSSEQFGTDWGSAVFQGPAYRSDLYYRMAFGDISANYLQWYRNTLPERPETVDLIALVDAVPPGANGLRLDTSRPPSSPEDVFTGLDSAPTRGQAVRCILEAVAVALRDQVTAIGNEALPAEIRSAGGAARSNRWLQIKADVLGIPIRATQCAEPTSLGAAILAEAGAGGAGVLELAHRWVRLDSPCEPDPERHRRYRDLYPSSNPG